MIRAGVVAIGALVMSACAQAQTPSGVGGDGIDRAEASNALGSLDRTVCGEEKGPHGPIHFTVTFAPDGTVADAQLDHGTDDRPTTIAGTPRGDCILARLRELHVPPFKGKPTKVGRNLTLE